MLVCTGGFCSPDRGGRALYALLPTLLEREGLLFGPGRVKRGETPCLGVCGGGPIVVRDTLEPFLPVPAVVREGHLVGIFVEGI